MRLGDGVGTGGLVSNVDARGLTMLVGGVIPGCVEAAYVAGNGGTGGVAEDGGGAAAALTARDGGPLGGGGFGAVTSDVAAPAFLLTHFFKSES